jgi:tetratricopeptide (TPR) repeat protein
MRAAVYLYLLASGCLAQSLSLDGQLATKSPTDLSHLVVRLETANHATAEQTTVGVWGDFRFRQIDQGSYTLVVTDEMGHEITREPVNIVPSSSELRVELPEDPAAVRPSGAISVSQLRHRPDPRALRAVIKAGKLSASGDYRGAAAQLEKAVAWDPKFAEAHGNLGAQYVRLHQLDRGAAEFRKAIALDPSSAMHQANLALALTRLGQTAEAVQWAQRALQIDSTNAAAHLVLGCILARDDSQKTEAVYHLTVAARQLPAAAQMLEELHR